MMVGTQIETFIKEEGGRMKEQVHKRGLSRSARPAGFTLVELLVVITIIGLLAALATGAAIRALERAKQTAITFELTEMSRAIEDLNSELGAYPPNAMVTAAPGPLEDLAQNDFVRMFKKAFPRHQEPPELIEALAGGPIDGVVVTDSNIVANGMTPIGGMCAREALVFWLGGFSDDPSFPISGPGGPSFADSPNDANTTLEVEDEVLEDRNFRYEFDLTRLEPRLPNSNAFGGRFIAYTTTGGQERRINLWRYMPEGSRSAYAYFDTSRHTPLEYDLDIMAGQLQENGGVQPIYGIKQLREGAVLNAMTTVGDVRFVEDKKYQILHAGLDDLWGEGFELMQIPPGLAPTANLPSTLLLAPEGPFVGPLADTLSHFMTGTIEEKAQ